MGLGQGCGGAPQSFFSASVLMINSHKRVGHGTQYLSCLSGVLFFLAAIVYVDDTDLLLRIRRFSDTEKDFARQIQQALWDWGMIVMATGGYLKQKKCYVSLSFFHFKNGKACLKKKGQLNTTPVVVPQPKGTNLPIPIIGPEE